MPIALLIPAAASTDFCRLLYRTNLNLTFGFRLLAYFTLFPSCISLTFF